MAKGSGAWLYVSYGLILVFGGLLFFSLHSLSYSDYIAWVALGISLLLYALATRKNGELKAELKAMRESIDTLTKEIKDKADHTT